MKLTALDAHNLKKLCEYGSKGWHPLGLKIYQCKRLASYGFAEKRDRSFFITEAGRAALRERE